MVTFPGFLPTAVGSLPHTAPMAACELVQRYLLDVPAWPQLPRRGVRESIRVQFSQGFPGVVTQDGRVFVGRGRDLDADLERLYTRYLSRDLDASALDGPGGAGPADFLTLRL